MNVNTKRILKIASLVKTHISSLIERHLFINCLVNQDSYLREQILQLENQLDSKQIFGSLIFQYVNFHATSLIKYLLMFSFYHSRKLDINQPLTLEEGVIVEPRNKRHMLQCKFQKHGLSIDPTLHVQLERDFLKIIL